VVQEEFQDYQLKHLRFQKLILFRQYVHMYYQVMLDQVKRQIRKLNYAEPYKVYLLL